MPHKRKGSPFWWVSFTDTNGKRIRCSTGTVQKKEAVALEAKWKAEAFRGKAWGDKPTRSLGDLMLEYMTATESKPSSDRDAYSAERLLDFFGANRDLASLKSSDITRYQKHRMKEISAGTYNKEVGLLSAAINYANLDAVFPGELTTTEWLARHIFNRLAEAARGGELGTGSEGIERIRVTLNESHIAKAWYEGAV